MDAKLARDYAGEWAKNPRMRPTVETARLLVAALMCEIERLENNQIIGGADGFIPVEQALPEDVQEVEVFEVLRDYTYPAFNPERAYYGYGNYSVAVVSSLPVTNVTALATLP